MSEQILLLNPRRRKRRTNRRRRSRARRGRMPAGLARYWASRRGTNPRRRRRRTNRRRRVVHARRSNPRVGRHYRMSARRRRSNPRRRVHRRRHNPRMLSMGRGMLGAYVVPAVIGGAGGLVLDIVWGYVSPKLPMTVQSGYAGLAAKLAVVLGAAYAMNRFVPKFRTETHRAAIGAATVLAYGAIKGAAQSVLPATTPGLHGYIDYQSYALPGAGRLAGYMPRTLGSLEDLYSPAAVIQPPGTAVPRQFGGLRGYIAVQPHVSAGNGGLMGYDWSADGM